MSLFLSVDFNQGDERFGVLSRGNQCAFVSLTSLVSARNIHIFAWSKATTLNILPCRRQPTGCIQKLSILAL